MEISTIPANLLTSEHIEAWSQIQLAEVTLNSPFFRPEFTRAVATVREDIEVAILQRRGEIIGFFPFQRDHRNIGRAVAWKVSELHGMIVAKDVPLNAIQLLGDSGLRAWHYLCVPATQKSLQPYHFCQRDFPYMDLSQGFDVYRTERSRAGSALITQGLRKARKIDREVGPLRLEAHTTDRDILKFLMAWKSAQYKRLGILNLFSLKWVADLLERFRITETEHFSGMLSALYVGDRVIAVHLGIRSNGVLSWWFPAFDRAYGKYSPGLILLTKLAETAKELGIRRIDLGQGAEQYKDSFKSGNFRVAEGAVDNRYLNRKLRQGWVRTRDWAQTSSLRGTPLRIFRRLRYLVDPT